MRLVITIILSVLFQTFSLSQNIKGNDEDSIYIKVEDMPTFNYNGLSGDIAIKQYVNDNFIYPEYAYNKKISGKVVVRWTVDPKGYVRDVYILRGIHPSLDYSVIIMFSKMPRWLPAKSRGECDPVKYAYFVNFDIQNIDSNSVSNVYHDEIDCMLKLDSIELNHILYSKKSEIWKSKTINYTKYGCKIKNDSIFIYGQVIRFPDKEKFKEELYLAAIYNDSTIFTANLDSTGTFKAKAKRNDTITFLFGFANPKLFSLDDLYYPIEIKNIDLNNDSIYLGIIPFIKDDYGRYGEWGIARKNIFQRYDHYYTETIHNMPDRLILEKQLTDIYDSICIKCDPIFVTKVDNWNSKKIFRKRRSGWIEERYFTIDYNELLRLSERLDDFQ